MGEYQRELFNKLIDWKLFWESKHWKLKRLLKLIWIRKITINFIAKYEIKVATTARTKTDIISTSIKNWTVPILITKTMKILDLVSISQIYGSYLQQKLINI